MGYTKETVWSVDYVTVSAPGQDGTGLLLDMVRAWLDAQEGLDAPEPVSGKGGYLGYLYRSLSATVYLKPTADDDGYRAAYVQIAGEAAYHFLTHDAVVGLPEAVRGGVLRITRFDVQCTVSHWERRFSTGSKLGTIEHKYPVTVGHALILDAYKRARENQQLPSGRRRAIAHTGSDATGHTLYIGRRGKAGSGLFIRLYDKGAEAGSTHDSAYRFELEFSKVANKASLALLAWSDAYRARQDDAWATSLLSGEWQACGSPLPIVFNGVLDGVGMCVRGDWQSNDKIMEIDRLLRYVASQVGPVYRRVADGLNGDDVKLLDARLMRALKRYQGDSEHGE